MSRRGWGKKGGKNMDSIVDDAVRYAAQVGQLGDGLFGGPNIVVVGCGGAGNNSVSRLKQIGIQGAKTIAINTDALHLSVVSSDTKLLVGKTVTRGLGAGGNPEVGRKCAEIDSNSIKEALVGSDLVFITAGMGGGTGTGTAPVVAKIAKDMGAITVGMVTTPFNVERGGRMNQARKGLYELSKMCDTTVILDNNKLLRYFPNLPVNAAFSVIDQLIAETVGGISETITKPSLINLDFADVKTIMSCGGVAVMLYGEAPHGGSADETVKKIVSAALNQPLLEVEFNHGTGALIHISGGPDLTIEEAAKITDGLTDALDPSANVIFGTRVSEDMKGKVKVMAIITGVHSPDILGPYSRKGLKEPEGEMRAEAVARVQRSGLEWIS